MKILTITSLLFSCLFFNPQDSFSQLPITKSMLTCEDTTYIERRGSWPINLDEKCKSHFYSESNFRNIPDKNLPVIESIEESIINRSGSEFYKKLRMVGIDIAKGKSCNDVAYVFRYLLLLSDEFNYRFELYFDESGESMGRQAFPSFQNDSLFNKLISPCTLVDSLILDEMYNEFYEFNADKSIHHIALEYDIESGAFIYVVYGNLIPGDDFKDESVVAGWWYGRKVLFDAKSGKKLRTERTKIFKRLNLY